MPLAKKLPQPSKLPIMGNVHQLTVSQPVTSFVELARQFDGIFKLDLFHNEIILVSSHKYADELLDEARFEKTLHKPLETLRLGVGDGLFTARNDEPNWGKARRILMSIFGVSAMRDMFDPMLDIAEQLLLKWERLSPDSPIDLTEDTTRLTLDTIALATMNYRFNSFYDSKMHPFVAAMIEGLNFGMNSSPIYQSMPHNKWNFNRNKNYLHRFVDDLIQNRRKNGPPNAKPDLLDLMLDAKDPLTGEKLDVENIRYQLITFLIAGHETTSGMLSFTIYELLKNPHTLELLKKEVRDVLGNRRPRYEDLSKLTYIEACLKESLRLYPTAPAFAVTPIKEHELVAGEYEFHRGQTLLILAPCVHRDPAVWERPEKFIPERMLQDNFAKIPPNAWRPFGNGKRSCIGRAFAMQESILFLAMLFQRFDLDLVDSNYSLEIKELLTIKPSNLAIKARPKKIKIESDNQSARDFSKDPDSMSGKKLDRHLFVAYGSNMGTGKAFAEQIAEDFKAIYNRVTLCTLDDFLDYITKAKYLVVVCSSYEGNPPYNAELFFSKINEEGAFNDLSHLNFTVFGCGDRNWSSTYQKVPKTIQKKLAEAGAKEITDYGSADAAGDPFEDFDTWYKTASAKLKDEEISTDDHQSLLVDMSGNVKEHLYRRYNLNLARVVKNKSLVDMTKDGARDKSHIELSLNSGEPYQAGDYLSVLPENSRIAVDNALNLFGLDGNLICQKIDASSATAVPAHLPKNYPMTVRQILTFCVDLNQPIRQKTFNFLVGKTVCPPHKDRFKKLAEDRHYYECEILQRNLNLIDFLRSETSVTLCFEEALEHLPPMQPRLYSISSSPEYSPGSASITVSIVDSPHFSGSGTYRGLCSNFLRDAQEGVFIPVSLKKAHKGFWMPENPQTPIVLIGAGSGIAPLRSFWQERAYQRRSNSECGGTYLFFGCDRDDIDYLYKDEILQEEKTGSFKSFPAFARGDEPKFVQHVILEQKELLWSLLQEKAKVFICGDGKRMAPAVRDTLTKIYVEKNQGQEPFQSPDEWLAKLEESELIVFDVFS